MFEKRSRVATTVDELQLHGRSTTERRTEVLLKAVRFSALLQSFSALMMNKRHDWPLSLHHQRTGQTADLSKQKPIYTGKRLYGPILGS